MIQIEEHARMHAPHRRLRHRAMQWQIVAVYLDFTRSAGGGCGRHDQAFLPRPAGLVVFAVFAGLAVLVVAAALGCGCLPP